MVTIVHNTLHYTDKQVHCYTVTQLHGYTVTRYTVTPLHHYTVTCTVAPLHGYTVTPLHAPLHLHGYTVTPLHAVTRLHRYTVTKCSTTKLVRSDCFIRQHVSLRLHEVAQNPLPLPEPYDKLWLSVTKVQHVSLRFHEGQNPLPLYQSPMICCGSL